MTPYDAMEQLKRCWAKLHIAAVDLKDIRESCPWLEYEDGLCLDSLIDTTEQAEHIADVMLTEGWNEDDDDMDKDPAE